MQNINIYKLTITTITYKGKKLYWENLHILMIMCIDTNLYMNDSTFMFLWRIIKWTKSLTFFGKLN